MDVSNLLDRVDTLKAEIDKFRPLKPELEQKIFSKFRLEWNFNSNAIEGNQISLGETQIFLEQGLTSKGKPFKDYLDIRGHDDAIHFLKDLIKDKHLLVEAVIRELHKILLVEPYETDAITPDGKSIKKTVKLGEYKSLPNHVLKQDGSIHRYASPEQTPILMADLLKWFHGEVDKRELHPVIIASVFHHRFTAIHPFDDGNGRLARLLTNLILMQDGYPPVIIKAAKRDEYIFALRKADQGDTSDLVQLIGGELINSEDLYIRGAKGESVEEFDDIDKEIRILKQQLQHINEPIEWSFATQQSTFKELLVPFFEKLTNKLMQFDEFFSDNYVRLSGSQIISNISGATKGIRGTTTKAGDLPRILSSDGSAIGIDKQYLIETLGFDFVWKSFKKSPLQPFDYKIGIGLRFEKLRFMIESINADFGHFHIYGEPLNPKLVADGITKICNEFMKEIRNNIKVK